LPLVAGFPVKYWLVSRMTWLSIPYLPFLPTQNMTESLYDWMIWIPSGFMSAYVSLILLLRANGHDHIGPPWQGGCCTVVGVVRWTPGEVNASVYAPRRGGCLPGSSAWLSKVKVWGPRGTNGNPAEHGVLVVGPGIRQTDVGGCLCVTLLCLTTSVHLCSRSPFYTLISLSVIPVDVSFLHASVLSHVGYLRKMPSGNPSSVMFLQFLCIVTRCRQRCKG
jgi:hypothetical protein